MSLNVTPRPPPAPAVLPDETPLDAGDILELATDLPPPALEEPPALSSAQTPDAASLDSESAVAGAQPIQAEEETGRAQQSANTSWVPGPIRDTGGFVKGIAETLWDSAVGTAELAEDAWWVGEQVLTKGEQGRQAVTERVEAAIDTVKSDPWRVLVEEPLLNPVADAHNDGNYGEATGLAAGAGFFGIGKMAKRLSDAFRAPDTEGTVTPPPPDTEGTATPPDTEETVTQPDTSPDPYGDLPADRRRLIEAGARLTDAMFQIPVAGSRRGSDDPDVVAAAHETLGLDPNRETPYTEAEISTAYSFSHRAETDRFAVERIRTSGRPTAAREAAIESLTNAMRATNVGVRRGSEHPTFAAAYRELGLDPHREAAYTEAEISQAYSTKVRAVLDGS